jgi:hypothetical protein
VALCSFLSRGPGFHGLPFYYGCLAMPLLVVQLLPARLWRGALAIPASLAVVELLFILPWDRAAYATAQLPQGSLFGDLAQELTEPGDRVIAYPYQSLEYLLARRLPASGHPYFMPWQAAYNASPYRGIAMDPCAEVRTYRPKLMVIVRRTIWGKVAWDSYGGCFNDLANNSYTQIPDTNIHVRRDIAETPRGQAAIAHVQAAGPRWFRP